MEITIGYISVPSFDHPMYVKMKVYFGHGTNSF